MSCSMSTSSLGSSTHFAPVSRDKQMQCPSAMDSHTGSTLVVREVTPNGATAAGLRGISSFSACSTAVPPPPYFQPPPNPYPTSTWSSTSSSQCSLGKRHSSWSNLVQAGEVQRNGASPMTPSTLPVSRPPSYGEFFAHGTIGRQFASRQHSTASSGVPSTQSGSKCSPAYFRFGGPAAVPLSLHAPLPAGRAGSALSSTGRVSSAGGASSQRSLQPRAAARATQDGQKKRDRMQELRDTWARPGCKLCCLALLVTLIGAVVGAAVLTETMSLPKHLVFAWFPPDQFRAGASQANRATMDVGEHGQQVRFELVGAPPFKSNFVSVIDFKTNKVAHLDKSLRSAGKNEYLVCFVADLDRGAVPSIGALQQAARDGAQRERHQKGWEEDWHWTPSPVSGAPQFQPEIAECRGARWIELTRIAADQNGLKCTECFDFCLPDWGIERDAIRDERYLNVLRRICFQLFVPEWRPFAQAYSNQQNQRDFEEFYRQKQQQPQGLPQPQQQPFGNGGGQAQAKWVSLQTTPQQPANVSAAPGGLFPSHSFLTGTIGQLGQQLFGANTAQQQQQQQPQSLSSMAQPQLLSVLSQFSPSELNGKGNGNNLGAAQGQHQPQLPTSNVWSWRAQETSGNGNGANNGATQQPASQFGQFPAQQSANGKAPVQPEEGGQRPAEPQQLQLQNWIGRRRRRETT